MFWKVKKYAALYVQTYVYICIEMRSICVLYFCQPYIFIMQIDIILLL